MVDVFSNCKLSKKVFEDSWQRNHFLRYDSKNNCQDLGEKSQKSKNFLGKKCKIFSGSLAKILDILGFLAKKSETFLRFLSTIFEYLAKCCEPCYEYLPKMQEFSWEENQVAKFWETGVYHLLAWLFQGGFEDYSWIKQLSIGEKLSKWLKLAQFQFLPPKNL